MWMDRFLSSRSHETEIKVSARLNSFFLVALGKDGLAGSFRLNSAP